MQVGHVLTGTGEKPPFDEFVKYHWGRFDPVPILWTWHMDVLCAHYVAWEKEVWLDWIVNMPPRHSKSIFSNILFPAWHWIDHPEDRFLMATSDNKLTNRDSMTFKRILLDDQPGNYMDRYGIKWRLMEDQSARDMMTNTAKGARVSVAMSSTNAAITGHNAEYLIVDDPNQALSGLKSEATRDTVNTAWDLALATRGVGEKSKRLVQQQRVEEDDLTGHILSTAEMWKPGGKIPVPKGVWVPLILRAVAEPDDTPETPIWREHRVDGELLCPERFGPGFINERKKSMRNEFFSQYQQRPSNPDGDKFKKEWFRYFEITDKTLTLGDRRFLLRDCWKLSSTDLAIGEKVENDYTVNCEWIITPEGDMCLNEVLRFQAPHHEVKQTLLARYTNFQPVYFAMDGSIQGTEIQQSFSLVGIPVQCIPNSADKIVRSMPASIMTQNGKVWFRAGADWLPDFEHELLVFPNGKHDDQVDSMAYGVLAYQGGFAPKTANNISRHSQAIDADTRLWRRRGFMN